MARDESTQDNEPADDECDHEWVFEDDSFDHEFGTETIHYWRCEKCDATRGMEPGDYDYDV